jgi:hypothetical protein
MQSDNGRRVRPARGRFVQEIKSSGELSFAVDRDEHMINRERHEYAAVAEVLDK